MAMTSASSSGSRSRCRWWPRCCRPGWPGAPPWCGARSRSGWRSRSWPASRPAARRPAVRHRQGVDLRAGHPLQARARRAQRRAGDDDDDHLRRRAAVVRHARVGAPAHLLLPLRARRERRARRLLRPGPGAVRGLLRPDADPVLLPLGDVGRPRPGARDDQAGHLHPGRLVLHARRRDRHRRAGRQPARHAADLRAQLAARPAALAHHADVGVPVLRRRLPGQDAARPLPRLAARRLQGDADPGGRGVLRDPVQGRRLRLPAHRAAAVPLRRRCTSRR